MADNTDPLNTFGAMYSLIADLMSTGKIHGADIVMAAATMGQAARGWTDDERKEWLSKIAPADVDPKIIDALKERYFNG